MPGAGLQGWLRRRRRRFHANEPEAKRVTDIISGNCQQVVGGNAPVCSLSAITLSGP